MTTALTPAELAQLDAYLPSTITPSMLNGYLAASASGPNFAMPDQILRWVWPDCQPGNQAVADLIVHRYQSVNDALNDQTYVPNLTDPQAWCQPH
jgi:hypothetical protein